MLEPLQSIRGMLGRRQGELVVRKWSARGIVSWSLPVALVAGAAVAFWATATSTSWARIAALMTVEPYAFAVHEQLAYNFGVHGEFVQTIHRGYDDAWTWSGHRAPTLLISSWLYSLAPSPRTLSQIMILAVLAGAIPAALIGRRALRSRWGLVVGGLLYLGSPAVMALALQDYQDLVFALPCLVFAMWAFGARHMGWIPLGVAVGLLAREECVPLVVVAAAVISPATDVEQRWKRRLVNVGVAAAMAGAYAAVVSWLFPINFQGTPGAGHDMPLVNASREAIEAVTSMSLPGLQGHAGFYLLAVMPLGLLALLSPATALAGLALVGLHMTVPHGHGVDRSWAGHAHHLAPAMAFLTVASIRGTARLLRFAGGHPWRESWSGRDGWPVRVAQHAPWIAAALGVVLAVYTAQLNRTWSRSYNLVVAAWPTEPEWVHPAWSLAAQLPEGAVPATFLDASLTVSNRSRSYTYHESLQDKAGGRGLGAATHMLVDSRDARALTRGMAMPGAHVVSEVEPFALLSWDPGAMEPGEGGSLPGGGDSGSGSTPAPHWLPPDGGMPPGVATKDGITPFGRRRGP